MPETMWKRDANIIAAEKMPGWREFHRTCGRAGFSFDIPVAQDRRRAYSVDCFRYIKTSRGFYTPELLSNGTGKTVLDALAAAHDRCRLKTAATSQALRLLVSDDFDALLEDLC